MHTLIQDIRYAWRSLCKTRGFTIVAVATLALGIAANTGVFSIIHAVLFRALPYSQPQRLVVFHWYGLHGSDDLSAPAFLFLRERAHSFTQIGAIYPVDAGVNLAGAGTTRYVRALHVSQEFFFTVNANPVTGRTFSAADDQPSAPATAVLSYGMWERLFHRAPSALGRQILVDGEILVVVGVMPREFRSYPEADIWIPLQLDPAAADAGSDYRVVGRLKPGIDLQQARSELAALSQEYRLSPNGKGMAPSDVLTVENLQDFLTRGVHRSLMVLWGAVLLVLMIVCTNLALLVSVRALNKNHELAVRAALGAGRIRLLRIFVIESMILVLIGAVLGVILAKESLHFVVSLAPANLPIGNEISIDRDVLLFAVAVSVTSGLFFGLVPAFRVFRVNLDSILRQGPHGIIPKTEHARSARLMVAIQTALSLILLSGAVLLMKSFLNLQAVPPGFDPNRVWVAQVSLRASRYATTSSTVRLLAGMLERLRSYPGVDAVASIDGLPLEKGLNLPIYPAGSSDRIVHVCWYRIVSPDYFRALRIQQISGRTFMDTDDGKSAPVAIVNETLARRWWQHNSALGHYVNVGDEVGPQFADVPRQIVGVVSNIHETGMDRDPPPTIFVPVSQTPNNITGFVNKLFLISIVIRTSNVQNIQEKVSDTIASADPVLSLASLRPLPQVVSGSLARYRFYAILTTAFGSFALLLTAIGLYGLLSYQTSRRTREISLRMALGAQSAEVVVMLVKEGLKLVSSGLMAGIVGTLFLTGFMRSMLYNFTGLSWGVLLGSTVLLLAVAILASLATAAYAVSIEPMLALRSE